MNEQKTVIVLGMHRGGTSVTAGILQALGVEMGEDAWGCNYSNPFGHFEDQDFNKFNIELLRIAGGDWAHPPSREKILSAGETLDEAGRAIVEKRKHIRYWGWKDPQTALTLEYWMPFLNRPYFVIVFRNLYDIALSLQERDGFDVQASIHLALLYYTAIDRQVHCFKSVPKICLAYEDILVNPNLQAKRVADFLEIDYSQATETVIKKFVVSGTTIAEERKRYSMESPKEVLRLRAELNAVKAEYESLRHVLASINTGQRSTI